MEVGCGRRCVRGVGAAVRMLAMVNLRLRGTCGCQFALWAGCGSLQCGRGLPMILSNLTVKCGMHEPHMGYGMSNSMQGRGSLQALLRRGEACTVTNQAVRPSWLRYVRAVMGMAVCARLALLFDLWYRTGAYSWHSSHVCTSRNAVLLPALQSPPGCSDTACTWDLALPLSVCWSSQGV